MFLNPRTAQPDKRDEEGEYQWERKMSYMYGTNDFSLYGFGFSDPTILESMAINSDPTIFSSMSKKKTNNSSSSSPPKHRHDGTSPLPLGMDWSPPPRTWDGRNSVWPHDPHTGWSYCVTIPSWIVLPSSDPAVFYRVQVGIQSPEGITTIRVILKRFSDFLKLFSDLKNVFPDKTLPPAPPRKLLRMKSRSLLEERRRALEDWMEKLLSDIDLSRTVHVAIFLELEAAVRSSFYDSNQIALDENLPANSVVPSYHLQTHSDASLVTGSSSFASDFGNDFAYETSELGTPKCGRENDFKVGVENSTSNQNLSCELETTHRDSLSGKGDGQFMKDSIQDFQVRFPQHKVLLRRDNSDMDKDDVNGSTSLAISNCEDVKELSSGLESCKLGKHARPLSTESVGNGVCSVRDSEILNLGLANSLGDNSLKFAEGAEASKSMDLLVGSGLHIPSDFLVALPSEERQKMNRVFLTMQQRLATANTDMEDIIARLNQELAVKQYLTTRVKDLEMELETTKQSGKENLQQAILIERDKFTQMQWDTEDFRRKYMELELKLKSEQDEKMLMESTKISIIQQNQMLLQELDITQEKLENLQKHQEELELKSKSDVKLLIKEVKALRSSQLELKHEVSRLMKEKLEGERVLRQEKQRSEHANAANVKLLHECEVLCNRLKECSVNFLVEEEDNLAVDTSPTDAVDLLTTSDNQIGFLLAEAQLLSQDVENNITDADHNNSGGKTRTSDNELRSMLTDMFVDNARLRKQVNSIIRWALSTADKSDEKHDVEEQASEKAVLSKSL